MYEKFNLYEECVANTHSRMTKGLIDGAVDVDDVEENGESNEILWLMWNLFWQMGNENGPQEWCMVTWRAPVEDYKDDDQRILKKTTSVNNNQLHKRWVVVKGEEAKKGLHTQSKDKSRKSLLLIKSFKFKIHTFLIPI